MNAQDPQAGHPRRRTRPPDRRNMILVAARELFQEHGYEQVSMGDIADAVSIGPSALYRHFSGKQQLLFEVLASSITPVRAHLESLEHSSGVDWTHDLARVAAENVRAGALWQRESRHLGREQRPVVHAEVRNLGRLLTERIASDRPDLDGPAAEFLAWSAFAVLLSPSYYHRGQASADDVLTALAQAVVTAPAPAPRAPGIPRGAEGVALKPRSRREQLLTEAVRMFAARGYTNVGIEDIGASLGIAGPSVYNHFPTKIDVLVTALDRGWAYLLTDLSDALTTSIDVVTALRLLARSYVRFAVGHPSTVGLLITETRHLPEGPQASFRLAQREYVAEWVSLVVDCNEGMSQAEALTRVHAALAVVNDIVRTDHLRDSIDIAASLELMCDRLLLPHDHDRLPATPR